MPTHVESLFRPEPAGTPVAPVYLTELEVLHIRSCVSPMNTLGGYAVGRALHRKLSYAQIDLAADAGLEALAADVRRVHTDEQIAAGLHDRGRFTPAD